MMVRRFSRRGQLALAAGLLVGSLALIVIGVAWFTRPAPASAPLSMARAVKVLVAQPDLGEKTALVEIKSV